MSSNSKFIASVCVGAVVSLGIALAIILTPDSRPTASLASSGLTVQTVEQPEDEIQLEQSAITEEPRQKEPATADQESEVVDDLPTLEIPMKQEFDHPYAVEEEYDRFDDRTTISVDDLPVYERFGHKLEAKAFFILRDNPPSSINFGIVSDSDGWEYLDSSRRLQFILDGERFDAGEMSHDGTVGSGYVLEHMWLPIPLEQFVRILSAGEVEARLGTNELTITKEHLEALRDFASRIPLGNAGRFRVARSEE